jgi:hypothetical protein
MFTDNMVPEKCINFPFQTKPISYLDMGGYLQMTETFLPSDNIHLQLLAATVWHDISLC